VNLVPAQYRNVSVADVPVPLDEVALGGYLVGRPVYRRTRYLVVRNAGACAVVEVSKESELPLFSPVTAVTMIARPEETAFAERSSPFMVSIDGMWTDPADDAEKVAWVRSAWEEIGEFGTGGVYLNFTGRDEKELSAGVDSAFGRNLRRLAEIKATYDPENFFRLNNNIAPAG